MPTNEYLTFAVGAGANVMTQADYAALVARDAGFVAGTAKSLQLNKVWRQSAMMAAAIGQFIGDRAGRDALDDGNVATLVTNLTAAVRASARQPILATDTGTANTVIANFNPAITSPVADGTTITVVIAANNTGPTTMNVNSTGATAVLGLGGVALQGGELTAGSRATFMYVSGTGWMLIYSQAAALQVGAATNSNHAMRLGQATGRLIAARLITSTATYTPTTGTVSVHVKAVGGGGAGGGVVSTATGSTSAGCGGSAGGYVEGFYPVGTLSGLTMTIGAGGTGVAGSTGGSGTSTTFGAVLSASGGSGGAPGQNLVPPWILGETGNSAAPVGGNLANIRGVSGGFPQSTSLSSIISGRGGSSQFGAGGNSVGTIRSAGNAGTGPGAGGSGALEQSAGAGGLAGGNGSAGVILLLEYS